MYIKIAKKNRIIQILTQIDTWSMVTILSNAIISINSCVVQNFFKWDIHKKKFNLNQMINFIGICENAK
jgi:hypothetical protein